MKTNSVKILVTNKMSSKRFKRPAGRTVDYRETRTSDSDPYIEILSFDHIPTRTSSWDREICKSLMIEYVNAESIDEIVSPTGELSGEYKTLILDGWDRDTFMTADRQSIKTDSQGCIRPGMV